MAERRQFDTVLLQAKKVNKVFGGSKKAVSDVSGTSGRSRARAGYAVHAVNNVDFTLHRGEIISIVGESGSGKTTFAKILLGLLSETDGDIEYMGKKRDLSSHAKRREYWKNIQAIFQDPFSTFNQFFRV